jgi:N-acetylmuramoyl-L-alanine amidase
MKRKRLLLSLIALTVLASFPSNSFANNVATGNFNDISSHWAKKYIDYLAQKQLVTGTTDSTFEPDKELTKAEFSAMIVKSMELGNTVTAQTYAKDVNASDWYIGYVSIAEKAGIISEDQDGNLHSMDRITREDLASMIISALKYESISAELSVNQQRDILGKLADSDQISKSRVEEVAEIINAKIMNATNDVTFGPQEYVTRAQASVVIVRFLNVIQ